jgi:seryl-tRNA synthetase
MLELSRIRTDKEQVIAALSKRNINAESTINELLSLDTQWRGIKQELDRTLEEANRIAKEIGQCYKEGRVDEGNELKQQTTVLKQQESALKVESDALETAIQQLLYQIPNTPFQDVEKGKDLNDNQVVFQSGTLPSFAFLAKPHWDLCKEKQIIDFELGVKVTGAGFPFYRGKGSKLQRALISFFLDQASAAGYEEYQAPLMVNEASGIGTGQLPDKEGQMYHVGIDDLYLIPTAEVPVTNLFRDVILNESELPVMCTGYTPCFRREAGSYGAHVRGLNRLHQFDKVEIVRIEHPDKSYEALDGMVEHVKLLLQELKLPYRILRLCGGDMGFTSALTYDFEVFSTAQDRWLEISSVSNFETFQANRLKLRYKDSNGKNQLAHTLNGSSLALPRVLAGILENYQTPEGIIVPEVLRKYTGFDIIN